MSTPSATGPSDNRSTSVDEVAVNLETEESAQDQSQNNDLKKKRKFTSKGLRPELPENMHPRLVDLMQRCWDFLPAKRPVFLEITAELEEILGQIQANGREAI